MRVLHINAGNLYGGVETLLVTLARYRNLCPEMEPSFALSFHGRLSQELAETGVPVFSVGEVRSSRYWTVRRGRMALRRLLKEYPCDVVVTHMSWSHAIFGPEVRRAAIPLVNWVHGISRRRSWLDRWAGMTRPDLVIHNSHYTASAAKYGFSGIRSEVVYLPVGRGGGPVRDRCSVRKEFGIESDMVVILQVSRMEAWKGHRLLISALGCLKDLRNWTCWIAGGAQRPVEVDYLNQLEHQVAEAGIGDRVRFLGQRSDVPSLLAASDIFCQPNQEPEPFGIVFIEALQAGLPLISTRMGGACEIVNESCGVLVPPGDPQALGNSLRWLVESPAERRALGQAGLGRARALCDPLKQITNLRQALASVV